MAAVVSTFRLHEKISHTEKVGRFSATICGKIFSILIVQDTINLAGQM
jgi:hypothetical protein